MGLGDVAAAAEKIREERRLARKQFKIDRAQAMVTAAKEAEAVLTTGQTSLAATSGGNELNAEEIVAGKAGSLNTPVDLSSLTPQTFLVRPTRPDANRNRGRKGFKRRPVQSVGQIQGQEASISTAAGVGVTVHDHTEEQRAVVEAEAEIDVEEFDESLVEDMEHLQLGLEEAWFLSSALGVLRVFDPTTVRTLEISYVVFSR